MESEKQFNAYMVAMGYFILGIYVGIDVFIWLYASPAWAVFLFLIQFPSKQQKEILEDMNIFLRRYRHAVLDKRHPFRT